MARPALSSKHAAPHLHEGREHRHAQHRQREALKAKTFEQLTNKEKDRLLKTVAISMGLIQPSSDGGAEG